MSKKRGAAKPPTKKAAVIIVKAQRGELPGLVQDLNDIGKLRTSLADNIRLHNLGKPIRDAARESALLEESVLTPYRGEGGKIAKRDIPEATAKIIELRGQMVELGCPGPAFDLTPYLPKDGEEPDPTHHRLETNTLTDLLTARLVVATP